MGNTVRRRFWMWSLILLCLGCLALWTIAWFVAKDLSAPKNRSVGRPPLDVVAQVVDIPSESGGSLAAWHCVVPESPATILLLHPIGADRTAMLSRSRLFQEHGYSTLLIDFQAHGESAGSHVTAGFLEQNNVIAALGYLRRVAPSQKIGIVGWSLGGASAVLAAPDVDAVVIESVYSTLSSAVHNRVRVKLGPLHHILAPVLLANWKIQLGISPAQLRPVDSISELQCPTMVASGSMDERTTLAETQALFENAVEPKRLLIFEGARHEDLLAYDPTLYEEEVVEFLNKYLQSDYSGM